MSIRKASPRELVGGYMDDIAEFDRSGWECAEVEYVGNPTSAYNALKQNIRRHDEYSHIRVKIRKGHIYLLRQRPETGLAV